MNHRPKKDTKLAILDATEELMLTRGYNAFSYRDIAEVVGIRKASIHHHFASKEILGTAFVDRYYARFQVWREHVADLPVDRKLTCLLEMFKHVSDNAEKICPMGMLTAEYPTLPKSLQDALCNLLGEMDMWLVEVLARGQADNILKSEPPAPVLAKLIFNAMSASMKMARVFHDLNQMEEVFNALMAMIRVSDQSETPRPYDL